MGNSPAPVSVTVTFRRVLFPRLYTLAGRDTVSPGRGELWRLVIPDLSAADIIAEQALALLGKHILLACTLQDKPVLINAGLFPKGTAHVPQA